MMEDTILEVENLRTSFATDAGSVQSVRGITFHVGKGESLGIVGESGCGKSVTMLSIMGLLEDNASRQADALLFDGEDLLKKSPREMRKIQGNRIGMMLEAVGLPSPERRLKQYPHELSGGMRQRVMIAIAMCCKPELLIADEPTTALDVTIQAQILELMAHMKNEFNTSVILITHDLGVISSLCTRVIVMYGGLIMEEGKIEDIFYRTGHPYTAGLLASIPKRTKEKLVPIFGTPPDLLNPPKGCPFAARCSRAMKLCAVHQPPFCDLGNGHVSACWLHNESVKARIGEVKL